MPPRDFTSRRDTCGGNKYIYTLPDPLQLLQAWFQFPALLHLVRGRIMSSWVVARPHKGALFCQIGYRAFIDNEWFNGRWSPLQLPLSIAYKELFPVVLAAHVWGPHRHILFHVDNETVVHILNMPLVLRGHMTNASFKQWVGILLMPKIDAGQNNYLTPEIWKETHLREIFYGTLIYQQRSMICIGRQHVTHLIVRLRCAENVTRSSFQQFPWSLRAEFLFRKR